ncbi:MAG: Cell division protein ftsA, partial [Synergistales bacterium 53_16]
MKKTSKDPELFAGLDIGTRKTAVLVAEKPAQDEELHVIGVGKARTRGIRKGIILEPEAVIESIRNALDDAESMIGLHIKSAYLSLGLNSLFCFRCNGSLDLGESQDTITLSDVRKTMEEALSKAPLREGDIIIHAYP